MPACADSEAQLSQKGMLNESGCSLVGQLLFIENNIIHDYAAEEGMSTGIAAITKQAYKHTHLYCAWMLRHTHTSSSILVVIKSTGLCNRFSKIKISYLG